MKSKVFRVILFFLVITLIPTFTLFGEKEKISYNENKTLAEFPEFSFENYKNRAFMNGMNDFFSDHFIFREGFIKLKNSLEKAIGKNEINGIIQTKGNLVQTFKDIDYSLTDRNLASLNKLKAKNPDTPFYFMPIITAQEKLKSELPSYLALEDEAEYINYCFGKLNSIEKIDVSREIEKIDYAFYRTDHHWTTECAFAAYTAAGKKLGYNPMPKSAFNIETVTDEFKGTLYSKTLDDNIKLDSVSAYRSNSNFTLTIKDKTHDSLYFDSFLNEKDKYSYFLGGNHGICFVENKNAAENELLIIKDSYANCFIPFIAEHYSKITVIDPRYCAHSVLKNINPSDFDGVLVLFNVSGFSQEQNFTLIEFMGGK